MGHESSETGWWPEAELAHLELVTRPVLVSRPSFAASFRIIVRSVCRLWREKCRRF